MMTKYKSDIAWIDLFLIFLCSFFACLMYASFWSWVLAGSWLAIIPTSHLFYAFMLAILVPVIAITRKLKQEDAKLSFFIGTNIFVLFVAYIIPVEYLSFISPKNPIVYSLIIIPPLMFSIGMIYLVSGVKALVLKGKK